MLTKKSKEIILKELTESRLFSYTIPTDDGAAPNPYWGVCTLVICKPVIRRNAEEGDWVVGLGSKNSPIGDISHKIVYIMRVSKKMLMKDYDSYCIKFLAKKIPDIHNRDRKRHVGDCIYDYSVVKEGKLRPSVHKYENRKTDLGGVYALLSDHFYYFGDNPTKLPLQFRSMIKSNQGHKSTSNEKLKNKFINWLLKQDFKQNKLYGKPQKKIDFIKESDCAIECSKIRKKESEKDEELEKK